MNFWFLDKREIKIFLTFFIIYAYFIQASSWNENSKLDLTRAIVDEGRFEIDNYMNNTGDRSLYNGHYYSDKAPGQSFLAVPIYGSLKFIYYNLLHNPFPQGGIAYAISKIIKNPLTAEKTAITYEPINPGFFYLTSLVLVTVFTSSLFSALTVLLVYKISRYFSTNEKHRLLATITYGLGTLAFIYGTVFFTHVPATFFVFLSFYLLFQLKRRKLEDKKTIFLAGIFAGFSAVIDYTILLIPSGFIFYVLSFKKLNKFIIFVLAFLIGLSPLLHYNYSILGNPLKLVYAYTDPSIRTDVSENLGFSGRINSYIVYRHLVDPYRGFLFYHPILIFSLIGFYFMYKKYKLESILIVLLFLSFFIIMSGRESIWEMGSSFGGRYYLPITPFLMLPLLFSLKKTDFTIIKPFIIISIFVNFIGLQNWEFIVGGEYSVLPAPQYQNRLNSFEILANPLKDYYFPLFLKNGPRARIVENLLEWKPIDIRHMFSATSNYPFITLIPLGIILILLWIKEIESFKFFKFLKENLEIVFIPIIIILFFG